MEWPLALAFALAVLLAGAHSYFGERYILIRLFRRELPKLRGSDIFTKQVLRFAWHITSVAWIAMGAALLWEPRRAIALGFAASGVMALAGSRGRHYSYVVFLAIAALSWPW